jgi:hypothetical protein
MSKAMRTTLSLVVGLVLFSATTMARAGGNNANSDKNNKEHHSRLAKLEFWHHHEGVDKNAKHAQAQAESKQTQATRAQIKPATKQVASKNDEKQQHPRNMSKLSARKAPAANKTKPRQKTEDPKTASLKH